MASRRLPIRCAVALAGLGSSLWMGGCLFDSKYPDPDGIAQSYRSVELDTIYPAKHPADSVVNLYQPSLDAGLKPGASSTPEILSPVNVKDGSTGKVVQYRLTRQRFGSWDAGLEFKWNYFLLQSNFLFAGSMADTAGLEGNSQTLFERVHALDSFTNYFDSVAAPRIWNKVTTSTKQGAIGVAVKSSKTGDSVLIQQVVANSPAGRAGMKPGMVILAVDDSSVVGDSALDRFLRINSGDSGSAVKIEAAGPGSSGPETFNLVREPVAFPTVLTDSIQGVGYLAISGFTPNTVDSKSTAVELREGLIATRRFPVTILDLRDNGGGSLDEAMRMCDEILPAGTVIIKQLQRRFDETAHAPMKSEVTASASAGGAGEKAMDGSPRKFLLLGNHGSASASEIFLVSIREGADAPLMGIKTFGKGVGQTVRNTPAKGLSLITFLKFTSRSGLDYHHLGLKPDYPDSSESDSLLAHAVLKALEMSAKPAAKISAAGRQSLSRDAAALDWNRRQAIRPGVKELEP
jgi:C-terminal peptidase prc